MPEERKQTHTSLLEYVRMHSRNSEVVLSSDMEGVPLDTFLKKVKKLKKQLEDKGISDAKIDMKMHLGVPNTSLIEVIVTWDEQPKKKKSKKP